MFSNPKKIESPVKGELSPVNTLAKPNKFSIKNILLSEYLVLIISILYFIIFSFIMPVFASPNNIMNIFLNMLPLLVLAIGQTFVLILGGIDLSIPSVVALTSVVGAQIMSTETGYLAGSPMAVPVAILVMLLIGMAIGGFNGLTVTKFHMPPFIVTLTMMLFLSGVALWFTKSAPIYGLPVAFTAIARGSLFYIPTSFILVLIVTLLASFLLNKSVFGRKIYAIGTNAKSAYISGINVNKNIIWVYVFSGICAVIGSILLTGRLETGSPVLAQKMLLDIIGAVIIGGTSLSGGKGKILWTVYGVLFITIIDNSLNLLGISYFTIMMVKGLVIVFAAFVDSLRLRLKEV